MRLNVVFIVLLIVAATATSVAWRASAATVAGGWQAGASAALATLVGLAALALLIRIVARVTRLRSGGTGQGHA